MYWGASFVPSLSKCWRDCFGNGVRTGVQSGLEVVGRQFFFLWVLFWTLQILEQKKRPPESIAPHSTGLSEPIGENSASSCGAESKNLGNSICTLAGPMASVWLISHQPQLGPFPRQRIRKRRREKKLRKEESGTGRRKRKRVRKLS